jgi:hypothetical protein
MTDAFRISIADLIDEAERREVDRRTDECWELLDEVRAGEERESSLVFLNKFLVRQISELQAELEQERSRYTLGGVAPSYHAPGAWANRAQPPPSASDESAPPLKRGLS